MLFLYRRILDKDLMAEMFDIEQEY